VAVEPREAILTAPAVDECHAVGELRLALFSFVLAPIEFEQLDEIKELQEACPVLLIVVVSGPKDVPKQKIVGALNDVDSRVRDCRTILAHDADFDVPLAVHLDPARSSFEHRRRGREARGRQGEECGYGR